VRQAGDDRRRTTRAVDPSPGCGHLRHHRRCAPGAGRIPAGVRRDDAAPAQRGGVRARGVRAGTAGSSGSGD
jgi:hypothetical protein